jgi:hypothetical protein
VCCTRRVPLLRRQPTSTKRAAETEFHQRGQLPESQAAEHAWCPRLPWSNSFVLTALNEAVRLWLREFC